MSPQNETPSPKSLPRFWAGLACLLLSVAASVVLVGRHLNVLVAPGCGQGSPCDQAAASAWGTVPIVDWPVSYVGLAYFGALVAAWIAIRRTGTVPSLFRHVVRVGVAFSAMFMAVMIVGRYACAYCIAVHLGHIGFLAVLEFAPVAPVGARRALGWTATAFLVLTGLEIGADLTVRREVEEQLAESTREIIEASTADASTDPDRKPFTGRYLQGPTDAAIRIVLITDLQCPDCKIIDQQVRNSLARHDNVSVSVKHFPFCTACNRYATRNMHANACWAARAVEAAGILRGNDGFWQMYRWLVERGASFTDSEIRAALGWFGYDANEFLKVMQGEETLRLVQEDIEEARTLGIMRTPMIFINGVELKGWIAKANAVGDAVDALAARNPPPGDARQDRPPLAFEKYVADWREEPPRALPPDAPAWAMGPDDAAVEIVAWGDYQEPFTGEADGILRRIAASRGDVRYTFRHYPIDQTCNPVASTTIHPNACLASRAVEAAGTLAGNNGYWAMHRWLFANLDRLSEQTLMEAAAQLGINQASFLSAMGSAEIDDAIARDAEAGKALGITSVPFIFINGKNVPRWRLDGALDAMIEEAARDQSSTKR